MKNYGNKKIKDDNIKVTIDYETDITKYSYAIRRKVASRFETREDVLDILSNDLEYSIRARVAKNISTSKETLLKLTKDENPYVRAAILMNKNIDKQTFNELVNDEHYSVKLAIIDCPFVTNEMLNKYMDDEEKKVRILSELKLNGIEITGKLNLHALEFKLPSYQEKIKKQTKEYIKKEKVLDYKSLNDDELLELLKTDQEKIKSASFKLFFETRSNFIKDKVLILQNNESLSTKVLMEIYKTSLDSYGNGSYKIDDKTYENEQIIELLFKKFTNDDFVDELIKRSRSFSSFFDESKNYLSIEQLNKMYESALINYKNNKTTKHFHNIQCILTAPNIDEALNLKIFDFYKSKSKTIEDYETMEFIKLFYKNNKHSIEMNEFFFNKIKNYEIDSEETNWMKEQRNDSTKEFLSNVNLTKEMINYFKGSKNTNEIIGLIKNKSLPKEVLNDLLNTNNSEVKEFLSLNKETPINVLEKLAKDSNLTIQMNAYKTLEVLYEEFERGELDLDF